MSIPNVIGESTIDGYTGKILLKAAMLEFGRPIDSITGLPTGKAVPQGISLSKRVDTSTGYFGSASGSLRIFSEPTFIAFTDTIGDRLYEPLRWTIVGARVVSHEIEGHAGGDAPEERIVLAFTQVTVRTTVRNQDGSTTFKTCILKLS
ncbi:MAG TPA: type VI secretion system tube protein Hcp [Fimbriimonas sp.]|nr:type VI secretion system tube protein Hcp [Fimbriimonas sp.]